MLSLVGPRLMAQCVPATPTITGVSTSCSNIEQVFTTEPGKSSYTWTITGGTIRSGAGTNQVTAFLQPGTSATVSVSYLVGTCASNITSKSVTLTAGPTGVITLPPSAPPALPGSVCDGATIALSVPAAMTNYSWKFTNQSSTTATVTVVGGSITTNSVNLRMVGNWGTSPAPSASVLVECWYTDPANPACPTYSSRTVQVTRLPTISVSTLQTCADSQVQVTGSVSTMIFPVNFSWNITDLAPVNNQVSFPNTSITFPVTWTTAGAKTINMSVYGCAALPVVVNVNPRPATPTVTASVDPVCVNSPVTYSATGLTNYIWATSLSGQLTPGQFDGTEVTGSTNASSLNLKWLNTGSGYVYLMGSDANGCTPTAGALKSVTVNGPGITGPNDVCVGAGSAFSVSSALSGLTWSVTSGVLTPSGANATITWSTAPATSVITVTGSGTVGGCTITPSQPLKKTVTIRAKPTASFAAPAAGCLGSVTTYIANFSPPGLTGYQWSVQTPDLLLNPPTTPGAQVRWMQSGSRTVSLTVTDIYGCVSAPLVKTVTVEVPPAAPIITAVASPNVEDTGQGNPINVCSPNTVTLTTPVVAGATYQWFRNGSPFQSGGNSVTLTSAAGTASYSVTLTKGACTVASAARSIVYFSSWPVNLTASGPTTLCPAGSVQLTATPTNLTLQWLKNGVPVSNQPVPPNTSQYTVVYPSSGSYSVQSSYLGCPAASATPISVTSEPTPITISAPTTCLGGGVSSIVLTASGPTGTFNWTKDGVAFATGQSSVTVVARGTYVASQTSAGGCTATSQIVINDVPVTTLNTSTAVTACGSYTLSLTNSPVGQTYQWFKDGTLMSGQTASQLNISTTGTYRVTATNTATGCTAQSLSINVTINPLPDVTLNTTTDVTQCGSYTLALVNVVAGNTYQWTKDGVVVGTNASQLAITTPSTGFYKVKVTTPSTCFAESATIRVTVNAIPTVSLNTSTAIVQCGGSYNLSVVSPPTGVNYEWTKNNVVVGTNASTLNIANGTGSYKVKVTTIATGCSFTTSTVDVTVNPVPAGTVNASGPLTFCQPSSVTLQATDGSSWQWRLNGTVIPNETSSSLVVTSTGNYSVMVMNASGCSTPSDSFGVTAIARPSATISPAGSPIICAGGSLTATGGSTYQWYLGGVSISGATSPSLVVPQSGSYTVVPFTVEGCAGLASAPVSVTLKSYPSATITTGGPTTFCDGNSVTLSVPAGADSYAWYRDNVLIGSTAQVTAAVGGSYRAVATNGTTCSTPSGNVSVTVNALPATPNITAAGTTTLCTGQTVILNATGGSSYQWRLNGSDIAGATGSSFSASVEGSYSTVSVSAQGCLSLPSNSIGVVVNPYPTSTITALGPTTFCSGGSVVLAGSGGDSYTWYLGPALYGTGQQITATQAGDYIVVTKKGYCSTPSVATRVTVNPRPGASVSPASLTFCSGSTGTLTATPAGKSYQWFVNNVALTNETGQSILIAIPGNFQVRVTDTNGCDSTSTGTPVSILPRPVATPGYTFSCGQAILSSVNTASAYLWSNGATGIKTSVSTPGTYSLSVRDDKDCWSLSSDVSVGTIPATTFTSISQSNPLCPTGYVNLTPNFNYGNPLSYSWSNGDTSPTTTVYTSGTFNCTIAFEGGCSLSRNTNVVRQSPCMMLSTAAPEVAPQQLDEAIVSTTLFPNPANTEVMITTPPMSVVRRLTLFNMQGVAVHGDQLASGASRHSMKLPVLAEGLYLLRFDGVDGVEVHKVIIRKE